MGAFSLSVRPETLRHLICQTSECCKVRSHCELRLIPGAGRGTLPGRHRPSPIWLHQETAGTSQNAPPAFSTRRITTVGDPQTEAVHSASGCWGPGMLLSGGVLRALALTDMSTRPPDLAEAGEGREVPCFARALLWPLGGKLSLRQRGHCRCASGWTSISFQEVLEPRSPGLLCDGVLQGPCPLTLFLPVLAGRGGINYAPDRYGTCSHFEIA